MRRQLRRNTGALDPVGGGDRSPGLCAGLCGRPPLPCALIERLSPRPCPIVLHSPPHPISSWAAPSHLSAKGPVGPREFHVHPVFLLCPLTPRPAGTGSSWLFAGRGKERLPASPGNALGGPSHPAGGPLCRQGHQPVLVSVEVARTCPGAHKTPGRRLVPELSEQPPGSATPCPWPPVHPDIPLPPREQIQPESEGSGRRFEFVVISSA